MIELLILVVGVTVILLISYFLIEKRQPEALQYIVEQHRYSLLTDVANQFYFAKISGTEKTLSQLVADRVASGSNPVTYGKGFGNIDVDKQLTEFFDRYFGKDHWRFEMTPPRPVSVAIVVDTSSSIDDDIQNINSKVPKILEDLEKQGKVIFFNYYLLSEGYIHCSDLKLTSRMSCYELSRYQCNLQGQQLHEDWGDGVACAADYYEPKAVMVITDELSGGSEPCMSSDGADTSFAQASAERGINAAKRHFVKVFPLMANFLCQEACGSNPIYCSPFCTPCTKDKLKELLERMATETGGKLYDLSGEVDSEEIVREVLSGLPSESLVLGYEKPRDVSRVQSFEFLVPAPTVYTDVWRAYLYVW
jgi:hypothetical protein